MAGRPSPSSLLGEGFLLFDGNGLLDAAIDGVIFLFSSKRFADGLRLTSIAKY